jgi:hypothetical protein
MRELRIKKSEGELRFPYQEERRKSTRRRRRILAADRSSASKGEFLGLLGLCSRQRP